MIAIPAPLVACGRSLGLLAPMLIAMALCWVVGRDKDGAEFYPLSSFPMYSQFEERTYLTYLKSAEGQPLGTVPTINMVSSQLKKRYGDGLDDLKKQYKGSHFDWTVEQKRAAALATLDYLRDTHAPQAFEGGKLQGIRLIDVRLYLKDGKLVRDEQEIAQFE